MATVNITYDALHKDEGIVEVEGEGALDTFMQSLSLVKDGVIDYRSLNKLYFEWDEKDGFSITSHSGRKTVELKGFGKGDDVDVALIHGCIHLLGFYPHGKELQDVKKVCACERHIAICTK